MTVESTLAKFAERVKNLVVQRLDSRTTDEPDDLEDVSQDDLSASAHRSVAIRGPTRAPELAVKWKVLGI